MKILIVEDNSTDRELLIYLLESRFQREAKFREAEDLKTAFTYLERGDIDCIVLDLQLPDSDGRDTFLTLNEKYPDIPIVVMTHNQDRALALDMVQSGAADYIIKNFLNEEEIFSRIVFSIERQRRGGLVPREKVEAARHLDPDGSTQRPHHIRTIHVPEVGPKLPRIKTGSELESSFPPVEILSSKPVIPTEPVKSRTISNIAELSETIQERIEGALGLLQTSAHREKLAAKVLEVLTQEVMEGQDNQPSLKAKVDSIIEKQGEFERQVVGLVSKLDAVLRILGLAILLTIVLLLWGHL